MAKAKKPMKPKRPAKKPVKRAKENWTKRPGKLGGSGFLSRTELERHALLDKCVTRYGYRSCLGSIFVLERATKIRQAHGEDLAGLRGYLVKRYGGPGSFGPRTNPDSGEWHLVPEIVGPYRQHVKCITITEGQARQMMSGLGAGHAKAKVTQLGKKAPKKVAKKSSRATTSTALVPNPRRGMTVRGGPLKKNPSSKAIMSSFLRGC